jgi:hypothetical protein
VVADDEGEVRWNALFNPEAAQRWITRDALQVGIAGLVVELGRDRASAYLHTLANTVLRAKPNALLAPLLPAQPRPRRGQPRKRDIQQHALRFLKEEEEQGEGEPKLTFREFGRRIAEEAKHRGCPAPYSSLDGYAAALGQEVRKIRAEPSEMAGGEPKFNRLAGTPICLLLQAASAPDN